MAVDPTSPDAATDAALGLAVAYQAYQFLNDASSASADVLTIAANSDPDDPNAAALTQASLDQASYSLLMASNNLGLLTEEYSDSDVALALVMADGTPKTPKTIKAPDGTDLPAVPDGATGTPSDTSKGLTYPLAPKTPGLDPRVTQIRIMDPTNLYPDGYAVYMNQGGQTVNPRSGRTTSGNKDPWGHIPLSK